MSRGSKLRVQGFRSTRSLLGGSGGRREPGHDDIDIEPHQFCRQLGKAAHLPFVRSDFESDVLPLDVAEFFQPLGKDCQNRFQPGALRTKTPIVIIFDCCAEAASGHATAALPKCAINSRRFIDHHQLQLEETG